MKKLVLSLCLLLTVAISANAAKANSEPAVITQSDGTQLTVFGFGDEDVNWYTTSDGVVLVHIGYDYFVAKLDTEGNIKPSTQLAHEQAMRTVAEQQLIAAQEPCRKAFFNRIEKRLEAAQMQRIPIGSATPAYFPHKGSPKALVILVQFADLNFSVSDPLQSFGDYLNGETPLTNYGLREDRNYGGVRQYFTDMSEGLFTPQFDIAGPVTLPESWAYYGKNNGSSVDVNLATLIQQACSAVDNDVDFSQYDSNGDGNVDLVYLIYAGYSESITGNSSDCIWPKSGTLNGGTYDGVRIQRYGVNNELNYYPGRQFSADPQIRINGIGLFCHEFSHTMGLPDLYPTNNSGRTTDNQTMEYWDVMDGGEYTDNGYTPTPYTPWEKEVMGWIEIDELIDSPQKILMEEGKAYRISSDENNEYLILQNLQNTEWASKLLGHGMLIYRIDYPKNVVNMGDSPNNTAGRPSVTLLPADGLLINYYRMYGSNEANKTDDKPYSQTEYINSHYGDPFPGSQNVTELLSAKMNRCVIEKPLYNIKEENGVITFDYLKDFDSDGIEAVYGYQDDNTPLQDITFDMQGRKTDGKLLPKGIYIKNNKKIIIR